MNGCPFVSAKGGTGRPEGSMMKSIGVLLCLAASFTFMALCHADSITINGTTHENAYVRETATTYYVQFPNDGTVTSFPKAEVDPDAVVFSKDAAEREGLLVAWQQANRERKVEASVGAATAVPARASRSVEAVPSGSANQGSPASGYVRPSGPPSSETVTDGMVESIKLRNLPARDALKALLRQENLDFAVQDGYVWVSTPKRIRTEASGDLDTRYLGLRYAGSETVPKIVLDYPSGGTSGGGLGAGQGQGAAGTGSGGGAFRGGTTGNAATGFGGGGAGRGLGRGGGAAGGPIFGNISDLFTTINDTAVGETPALIGSSWIHIAP